MRNWDIAFISLGEVPGQQHSYSKADYLPLILKPQFACVYNVNNNYTFCDGRL